jgi:hypothetical protein
MVIRRGIKKLVKIALAGCIAIIILSIICLLYFNVPRAIQTNNSPTYSILEKNRYYVRGLEGYGYGKTNNEGFLNLEDYNGQTVDILIMGSSHMEGFQVSQKRTTASELTKLFQGTKFVYNIGISEHYFYASMHNLEYAIKRYNPEYVIIETAFLNFNSENLIANIYPKTKFEVSDKNKGLSFMLKNSFLKEIPYIRLVNFQIRTIIENKKNDGFIVENEKIDEAYLKAIDITMQYLNKVCLDNNVKPIIFYHPHLTLNKDGSASTNTNAEYLALFEEACNNNAIYFIDMTTVFMDEYKKNHTLPHGFANTAVGTGHLNKYGHKLIANALFHQINKLVKDGSI